MAINVTAGSSSRVATDTGRAKYRDLHMDLEEQTNKGSSLYNIKTKVDLKVSEDEAAIINSLKNIFTTTPGEKILRPDFGLNLTQWLFRQLDEFTAREIGEAIVNGIEKYEPRVTVKNVNVDVDYEKNQYTIQLVLTIPSLNIYDKPYDALLKQPGFDFLTNSPT